MKAQSTAFRNRSSATFSMATLPISPAKNRVAMVILVIWPSTRMVAAVPEARPYFVFSTELNYGATFAIVFLLNHLVAPPNLSIPLYLLYYSIWYR